MKITCYINKNDIKIVHDDQSVIMYIVNYYCDDQKVFDYLITFCPVCGFQPKINRQEYERHE